jgi:hypothetical protein
MKPAATMIDDRWQQRFEDPILLPDGRALHTLREATDYITSLPKSESELAEWRITIEALGLASRTGPTALARIAFVSALTRNTQPGNEVPLFAVRLLDGGSGYVIDAVWEDGRTEQIAGVVFMEAASAAQWVRESSATWINWRLTVASNIIRFRSRPK